MRPRCTQSGDASTFDRVVVIGSSSGGVTALLAITQALPPSFPAPICIVQHVGTQPSVLPELLSYQRNNRAVHVVDGQRLAAGTIYVAPPDHHILVQGDILHVTHGPKENHARPAIDPLFRSAALSFGPRLIGVILTGQLDDGSAGLRAVKDCGGTTVVQDPATAAEPDMPLNAMAATQVDHCVPLVDIAPLLTRLAMEGAPSQRPKPPEHLRREVAINRGEAMLENLLAIASPTLFTCPDCNGTLSEVAGERPLRFRCHTGHAFSARTLERLQADAAEEAMWNGVRALTEREMLLRRAASVADALGDARQQAAAQAQADRIQLQLEALKDLVANTDRPGHGDDAA
ncbi:MAG: chemotaxis protein CheB [Comamonadaceae bacterium]|nr:MAG: chemotaxis protein CheB [Comamonadaceae bacterium]